MIDCVWRLGGLQGLNRLVGVGGLGGVEALSRALSLTQMLEF